MKRYKTVVTSVIMLAGFYFRVWLYTATGITLVQRINNNLREPPVSAEFWDSLYLAGKFLVVILLLVLSGDLIRFYRNIRRHPVITVPRTRSDGYRTGRWCGYFPADRQLLVSVLRIVTEYYRV